MILVMSCQFAWFFKCFNGISQSKDDLPGWEKIYTILANKPRVRKANKV